MNAFLGKLRTYVVVSYAEMLEYRAEVVLWVLSSIMPFLMMGVWMQASQGTQADLGLTPTEFARYFLCVFLIRQVTLVWVIYEVERHVVEGSLSPRLLQPIDPFWRFFCDHLGERLARLPFLVILTALFFVLYPAALWCPSLRSGLLAALCLAAAFVLRFIMQYAFAMVAFWSERASAIEDFWFFMYLFLSGYLAPLSLFPEGVRRVAEWTPFPYLIYMPAQLLLGRPVDLGRGLAVMAVWTLVFFGLYRLLWRAGLRRYSGMGA
ncbi:MAG: multidrug ABC transporter permease [Lentisphaerae bacterium]|nr:multidrug ABC transporter permease [Lentisphaerota bacterium]